MIHTGADWLDLRIYAMLAAKLTDAQILRLASVRLRYADEPTWAAPGPLLEFARYLAEHGRIGRSDRYPTMLTIRGLDLWVDFAGAAAQVAPEYDG